MTSGCQCSACRDLRTPYHQRTTAELFDIIENRRDESHRLARVSAYIELFYRAGEFDPLMPYRVWFTVFGEHVPPPVSVTQFGAFQWVPEQMRHYFGSVPH